MLSCRKSFQLSPSADHVLKSKSRNAKIHQETTVQCLSACCINKRRFLQKRSKWKCTVFTVSKPVGTWRTKIHVLARGHKSRVHWLHICWTVTNSTHGFHKRVQEIAKTVVVADWIVLASARSVNYIYYLTTVILFSYFCESFSTRSNCPVCVESNMCFLIEHCCEQAGTSHRPMRPTFTGERNAF